MKDPKEIKEKIFQNEMIKTLLGQMNESERIQTIKVMDEMVDEMNKKFDVLSSNFVKFSVSGLLS